MIVLEAALNATGLVSRLLSQRWTVYVGKRSYALYLWHYPINYWLRGFDDWLQVLLAVALTFAVAEFRFV